MEPTEYDINADLQPAASTEPVRKGGVALFFKILIIIIGFTLIGLIIYANFFKDMTTVAGIDQEIPAALEDDTIPVIRNDVKAYIVSDIVDDNDQVNYYALRFYSNSNLKISPIIAVATSSFYIDEVGLMSIQIVDDLNTKPGKKYTSALVYEDTIDPTDMTESNIVVGEPCIMTSELKVSACDSFVLELSGVNSTKVTSEVNQRVAMSNGNMVKGISIAIAPASDMIDKMPGSKSSSKPHNSSSKTKNKPVQKKKEPVKNDSADDENSRREQRWKEEREQQEKEEEDMRKQREIERNIKKALDGVVDSFNAR